MHQPNPASTYRLQLHSGFTFDDAAAIADYLCSLGISHVYASPYLQAAPGSTHGYDVTDHNSVNQELGGQEGHERFCRKLGECHLSQIIDIVPNHMAVAKNNRAWWDVLENGPASRFAAYFDIDWDSDEARLRNKVLLPILDDQYGRVLAKGGIQIVRRGTRFEVRFADNPLPVAPDSLPAFLTHAAEESGSGMLAFISDAFAHLPQPDLANRVEILRRHRDCTQLYRIFDRCCADEPRVIPAIDNAIAAMLKNADDLHNFLQQQSYRLAYWRVADQDLGYRRFFDINSLIGLRMERAQVFEETHALILEWLSGGVIDGVRVDHADGLRDPQQYFERLRRTAPNAWVLAEKILGRDESLRSNWPVDGTTGYEFIAQVNGLLVSPDGLDALTAIYSDFIGTETDFREMVHEKKLAVTQESLGSDVNRLTSLFVELCENDRDHRDYTRADIRRAIREVAACFPLYRSYVVPDTDPARSQFQPEDVALVKQAVEEACRRRTDVDCGLFTFIGDVLTLRTTGRLESEFVQRFQQFTSPVMAKGVEDTALYCYNRLIALNEVGCDPLNAAYSIADFHRVNIEAQRDWPLRMVTLTTHDTKRGEDARARLIALSEMPECWRTTVNRWSQMNRAFRADDVLDPNMEFFYYQTLVGSWPLSEKRAVEYLMKAARESKQRTSWTHQDEKYESALKDFIHQTLANQAFCAEVDRMVERINYAGRINSLAQTLLKCTIPGVPDLYQGAELWEHRLVDPDNRTPVDFTLRQDLLREMKLMSASQVMERMEDGLPKLWAIHHALQVRHSHANCFGVDGDYAPVAAAGERSEHIVSFLRGGRVLTVVPRLTLGIKDDWQQTVVPLPGGIWRNSLTGATVHGGSISVSELLSEFPVALLAREN